MTHNKSNIAIVFFGITRSLKYTIKSINENIFDILKSSDYNYDIFLHTYFLDKYSNIRTGEKITKDKIDNSEYKLLNADYLKIDNQEIIRKTLKLEKYRTHKDPWNTKYNSVDNYILGSYSKLCATKMVEEADKKKNYKYIMFMRPDCKYLTKLSLDFFKMSDNSIVTPNFHLHGTSKINDRFAITNRKTYKIYGKIFETLFEWSKKRPLHSETILGLVLKPNKINKVDLYFARVRINGKQVDHFNLKI